MGPGCARSGTLHIKLVQATFPSFSRRGDRAFKPLEREVGVVIKEREALLFVDVTNRPVCAAKERDHQLMAQPPRLGKAGNVRKFDFMCKAPIRFSSQSASLPKRCSGIRQELFEHRVEDQVAAAGGRRPPRRVPNSG